MHKCFLRVSVGDDSVESKRSITESELPWPVKW